jgi:hypothetical protein
LGGVIHRKDRDGCACNVAQSDHHQTIPLEVLFPDVFARVKQSDHSFCPGIDARDIWPFVKIAKRAGKRQIALDRRTFVLTGNNVID